MPLVATTGDHADADDSAYGLHGLQLFRLQEDSVGRALRGVCPELAWDAVPMPPGGDRPLLPAQDAQCLAWWAVRHVAGDTQGLSWLRRAPLKSAKVDTILAWAVRTVGRDPTNVGGLLNRLGAAARRYDNADGLLTVSAADLLELPLSPAPAGTPNAAEWLAEGLTLGMVLAQEEGAKAVAWLEYHRVGIRQAQQAVVEGAVAAAARAGRLDAAAAAAVLINAAERAIVAEAAAATVARDLLQEPALWKYKAPGAARVAVGREELSKAGTDALGTSAFMQDRLVGMVQAEAAQHREGVRARALVLALC